jgi:glycerophosphoryl diester phosphodiesterase
MFSTSAGRSINVACRRAGHGWPGIHPDGGILARVDSTHPFLTPAAPGRPLAFAHRGGAADGDENTLAAFARAVALGYRHLETDVHATADGVAVVFHDATTQRMLGTPGRVAQLSWKDLSSVRVAGEAAVPRLDELLDAWPEAYVNIDVKSDAVVDPALAALRAAGALDRVLIASFSDERLARVRRLAGGGVATSIGWRGCARLWAASRLGIGGRRTVAGAVAVQMPWHAVDRRFVRHAHRLGVVVHAWTVNRAENIGDLLDAGVDGIMTDHLGVLRDVYTGRGLWPA